MENLLSKGTIEGNDILRERLYPDSRNSGAWASTNIVCKNGARLTCKGFGSSVRGAHPYWIVVADGLKDNVIYSQLQRQKSIDFFHDTRTDILVLGNSRSMPSYFGQTAPAANLDDGRATERRG